jgi:hypothetical protein
MDPIERKMRQEAANRVVVRASSEDIARMEMAFEWLRELRGVDSGMAVVVTFWALRTARGRSIRQLCKEKHWSVSTFYRKRENGLLHLTYSLNVRGVPVFQVAEAA